MAEAPHLDQVRASLSRVVGLLGDAALTFDTPEWTWREKEKSEPDKMDLWKWVDGDHDAEAHRPGIWTKRLLHELGHSTISSAFTHAWQKADKATIKSAHDALRKAYESREQQVDELVLKSIIEGWQDVVGKLAKVDSSKGTDKLARSWQVLSMPLSALAPEHFPIIAPTKVNSELGRQLLGRVYESGPDAKKYLALITAFRNLRDAAQERHGTGQSNVSLRQVAAWLWWLHQLADATQAERLIQRGHHIILQGPPGTGKTHAAEGLLKRLSGGQAPVRADMYDTLGGKTAAGAVVYDFVQFHATYDYEDFVRGYRARAVEGGLGFELVDGPFVAMITRASRDPGRRFILIIDEINRADLARVFGECIYLLDRRVPADDVKRVLDGEEKGAVRLRYAPTGQGSLLRPVVCAPENFSIVGTMNTADRSIALVDHALRRRFSFVDLKPEWDVVEQRNKQRVRKLENERLEQIRKAFELLNGGSGDGDIAMIEDERYRLGHSYFLAEYPEDVEIAIRHQVVPLLDEYRREGILKADKEQLDALLSMLQE